MTDHPAAGPEGQRLAHDLLQSVAIIQAMVAATAAIDDVPERAREHLAIIEREAQVVGQLCRGHLAEPSAGIEVSIPAVAERAAGRMRTVYPGELILELDDDPRPATVVGDALEWERSIVNLLENGCRAAGPTGKVLVRVTVTDDTILVGVWDSGPGFGEAPAGRSSLGLVAVMHLLDRHGGHLELRRSELGGAQLTMVVPRTPVGL